MHAEQLLPMYFAIDIETTGLDPAACKILEVAARILAPDLSEICRYSARVACDRESLRSMDPVVVEMHTRTGLVQSRDDGEFVVPNGIDWITVRAALFAMLKDAYVERERILGNERLAFLSEGTAFPRAGAPDVSKPIDPRLITLGAGVHFDLAFLREHAAELGMFLSHRRADSSTLKVTLFPFDGWPAREGEHTANGDIDHSIEVIAFARRVFGLGSQITRPMSDAERAAQRESFVRGQLAFGSDADEARERARHRVGAIGRAPDHGEASRDDPSPDTADAYAEACENGTESTPVALADAALDHSCSER